MPRGPLVSVAVNDAPLKGDDLHALADGIRSARMLAARLAEVDDLHGKAAISLEAIRVSANEHAAQCEKRWVDGVRRLTRVERDNVKLTKRVEELERLVSELHELGSSIASIRAQAGRAASVDVSSVARTQRAPSKPPSDKLVEAAIDAFAAPYEGLMSGRQIVGFFQRYNPDVPDYPGSGARSRWVLFGEGLRSLPNEKQWHALKDLCELYPGDEAVKKLRKRIPSSILS